ncbi:MAG: radical SAM protein [Pseudomonadales bacterium]|jgi:uncharacterized protein|nr:radical SAM protein [Pseudomonadales bacterium]
MSYFISHSVTSYKNANESWVIYNWLNGQHAEIFDKKHPLYIALDNRAKISPFEYEDSEDDFNWLLENIFVVSSASRVHAEIQSAYDTSRSDDYLHLIVLPVDQACNFSCVYCYEDHSQKTRMTSKHISAISNLVLSKNPKVLRVEYFGGEPLLNHKFIYDLNKTLQELSQKFGFFFHASATTNGSLLTTDLLNKFHESGLKQYQITVDGLPDDHNKLRISNNGKPTFDSVWAALVRISEAKNLTDLEVLLRINFNEKTSTPEKRHDFILRVKELFSSDPRVSILPRQIGDYSSLNNNPKSESDYLCSQSLSSSLKNEYDFEIVATGLKLGDFSTWLGGGGSACYAGRPNSLVIFPDMKIRKCTVAINNPLNDVGVLEWSGDLHLNENWSKWTKPALFGKDECFSCHYSMQCQSSACPLINIQEQTPVCPPDKFDAHNNVIKILNFLDFGGDCASQ